jgi:hypothetical protein
MCNYTCTCVSVVSKTIQVSGNIVTIVKRNLYMRQFIIIVNAVPIHTVNVWDQRPLSQLALVCVALDMGTNCMKAQD